MVTLQRERRAGSGGTPCALGAVILIQAALGTEALLEVVERTAEGGALIGLSLARLPIAVGLLLRIRACWHVARIFLPIEAAFLGAFGIVLLFSSRPPTLDLAFVEPHAIDPAWAALLAFALAALSGWQALALRRSEVQALFVADRPVSRAGGVTAHPANRR